MEINTSELRKKYESDLSDIDTEFVTAKTDLLNAIDRYRGLQNRRHELKEKIRLLDKGYLDISDILGDVKVTIRRW
jgi:hypothetical protein|nr:MAG TPA: hypothetical protein [Caudoviricetes sp.]